MSASEVPSPVTVPVVVPGGAYEVHIGAGVLDRLPRILAEMAPTAAWIVADDRVAAAWGERVLNACRGAFLSAGLVTFPAGEAAKTLATVERLAREASRFGLDRKGVILALGGGIVGDVAGFVAATWQRGVRFIQLPTTLLAQVDSSVGGKTGVNLPEGKNLVGAFHQPRAVLADIDTLATLPAPELFCGFAEAVKHGLMTDAGYFAQLERDVGPLRARDPAALARLVAGSVRIKAAVVARDEREAGERALLNLGHTFAHAYEVASGFAMRHGEAVAWGLLAACRMAEAELGLDSGVGERVGALLERLGLSGALPHDGAFAPEALLAHVRGDKKNEGGRLRFVLPERLGRTRVVAVDEGVALRFL